MYIGEQTMVGAAVGLQALGKALRATFGAFLTRAYDSVRMAAISRANLRLCGSHAGVSIGEDGPSQMALEDLAMMRGGPWLDRAVSRRRQRHRQAHGAMADLPGISYVRTTREATPLLYGPVEEFPVGGSKALRDGSDVALVAAGITLHESLHAADRLAADGISAASSIATA